MKLNTRNVTKKAGMTLLELTVVILVLLSLISILFIGARAWKKGADRAGCIMNIRNLQQAVRSYANMNAKNPNEAVAGLKGLVVGPGLFVEDEPNCPSDATKAYTGYAATVPDVGVLWVACGNIANTPDHVPSNTDAW